VKRGVYLREVGGTESREEPEEKEGGDNGFKAYVGGEGQQKRICV